MKVSNFKTIKSIIKTFGYNLSKVDLSDVSLSECDLRGVKFRKDKDIFQKIRDKNLSGVKMPERDYSRYNFKGVLIKGSSFTKKTLLPKGKYFFQIVKNRDLTGTVLPLMDFRKYSFKGVCIKNTYFPDGSLLTEDYDFFQKIKYKDCTGTHLPISIIRNLHLFNLKGVAIDLETLGISDEQRVLLMGDSI